MEWNGTTILPEFCDWEWEACLADYQKYPPGFSEAGFWKRDDRFGDSPEIAAMNLVQAIYDFENRR